MMGVGAQVADHQRRREEEHGLSRSRPRAGGGAAARRRPAAQGDDHPARHGARRDHRCCPTTSSRLHRRNRPRRRSPCRWPAASPKRSSCNTMTTGAGNDIERATDLARKMVCEWGMSELGPLSFGKKEEQIFLGREIAQHRDYSEDDGHPHRRAGASRSCMTGYDRRARIIEQHKDAMQRIADELLEPRSARRRPGAAHHRRPLPRCARAGRHAWAADRSRRRGASSAPVDRAGDAHREQAARAGVGTKRQNPTGVQIVHFASSSERRTGALRACGEVGLVAPFEQHDPHLPPPLHPHPRRTAARSSSARGRW